MFFWVIGGFLAGWLVMTLINAQYRIDQEDWDWHHYED